MRRALFSAILAYFAFVNAYCIFLCAYDKHTAKKKNGVRVPEKAFFVLSALGASLGMLLSMMLFRHKTKHKSFYLGIPVILAVQTVLCFIIFSTFK